MDVDLLDNGDVVVSWLRTTQPQRAQIMLSRFDPTGALKQMLELAETSASRRSGFPVMQAVGNEVYVTWTQVLQRADQGKDRATRAGRTASEVRLARVSFASGQDDPSAGH